MVLFFYWMVIGLFAPLDNEAPQRPDIVIADFDGENFGAWKAEGEAFGSGPALGALPGQMAVEGFQGRGLVNSFHHGDTATGILLSPEFTIDRNSIEFLIGGGGFPGRTCVNLLVGGKVVRTAEGPNREPGGSERLELAGWNVTDLAGSVARIEVVDHETGGWGHINLDQVVLTDRKPPAQLGEVKRLLLLEKRFLHLPVKTGAKKHRVALIVAGATVREFEIELADDPEWFAHLDVSKWKSQQATLRVDKLAADSPALAKVTQADEIWSPQTVYQEPLRAQFHFSLKRGWNNDPNGMVFADGEYHLYAQHNPYGWAWGNMHWAHAVSRDLVHWQELPIAIYPRKFGDWAFSGSAVVDESNTSGWKTGDQPLLVGAFTSTGRGECIVYSNDGGRTWTEYEGNPVLVHSGRDPRLVWHEPTKQWVMVVYDEMGGKQQILFLTSTDLKKWRYRSRVAGFYECPDLFELLVDGDPANRKWVLTAASSEYMVGSFDGATFTPETAKLPGHRGKGFYAAQTFSREPKNRVVQVGWLQTTTPGMAFNQSMSLPLELKLKKTADGPRLAWSPVEELSQLRARKLASISGAVKSGDELLKRADAELVEVRADLELSAASVLMIKVRGVDVVLDAVHRDLTVHGHKVPLGHGSGNHDLVIHADRTCLEVFADGGLTYVPMPVNLDPKDRSISARVMGDDVNVEKLEVYELKSAWGIGLKQ